MDRPQERLALIELYERDGRVARAIDVSAWPLNIGRALDNHVVLDDPWVAAHHARLEPDAEGRLTLRVLLTRNGINHDGKRLGSGQALALPAGGTTLHIGATRLRLRLPAEVLAAERPLPGGLSGVTPGQGLPLLLVAVALLSLLVAGHWIDLDPGADYSAWLPLVVGLPLVLAAWCGGWALMSKLFQHRFDFGGHLRIALPWMLGIALAGALWPQLAAALAAPWLWRLAAPAQALLAALLVRAHLSHMLPLHQRAVTLSVAVLALAGGALSLALTYRGTDSLSGAPYMSTLPLPALRLAGSVPTPTLVREMAPLAAQLAQRVKKAREDEEADGSDAMSE